MPTSLYWNADEVAPELNDALRALAEDYPLREGTGSPCLTFSSGAPEGSVTVTRDGDQLRIQYGGVADALRGLGAALANLPEQGRTLSESRPFTTLGIMLDCSRNAVMKVDHVKRWLRRLSLFGYNTVMLYTEDTYRLPGEPFFGLFRGAYTPEELKDIDSYAARLGIEMIGCIQTLGHLEQILKWSPYFALRDTDRELLVGEPATYDLIRKMIANFADCFRSRRIHIGMDETQSLGRGRFLDLHGRQSGFDIITQHLRQVTQICEEHGLRPMIWSDMYFKFGGRMDVDYDPNTVIPDQVKAAIPAGLDLVYWDYYHDDEDFYLKIIDRHRSLGRDPVVASGVWTWHRLWYGQRDTEPNASACVRACKKSNLKELIFTLWGDDGGYCEFDSALAGLAFAAAHVYGEDASCLRKRYRAACGIDYEQTLLGSKIDDWTFGGTLSDPTPRQPACSILWDDPLLGLHWLAAKASRSGYWEKALAHFRQASEELKPYRDTTEPVDLGHAYTLAALLARKIGFRQRLEDAYPGRDKAQLKTLADDAVGLARGVEDLEATSRRQWLRRNKPFGFEVIQIRLAGLRQRYLEAARRLEEIAAGKCDSIPELDEGLSLSAQHLERLYIWSNYRNLATSSTIL